MKIRKLHTWDLTPTEAIALQRRLAELVICRCSAKAFDLIAGVDVSHTRFSSTLYAGVVVWSRSRNTIVEQHGGVYETRFPYIPGLLSFREAPALLELIKRLKTIPDVFMVDGHGRSHPREFGFACHLGVWVNRPALGCAKSRLFGDHEPLAASPGSSAALKRGGKILGRVIRTKTKANPVFVSVGHRLELERACRLVFSSCHGYRLPEPTRLAHLYVNALRRAHASSACQEIG